MPGVRWFVPLGCALLLGCAGQPSRSLPPGGAESGVSEASDPPPAAPAAGEPAAVASGSEANARAALPPPVSQEVDPPPPDPQALPPAQKRQLDIRLATQRFHYFEDDRLVWSGPISSGTRAHPTPKGRYRVQRKDIDKRSGSYTNSFNRPTPMPYALQFRGPYWVHEGYVTGEPESHGCVRLRHADAQFVYARIQVGDRIMVAD